MPEYGLYNGAWTGPEIDAAIGRSARISNPNLLDNWYFVGGGSQQGNGQLPINQRGQTTYSTSGSFTIDRWLFETNNSGSVAVGASGVSFTNQGAISEYIESNRLPNGSRCTLSYLLYVGGNYVLRTNTGVFDANNNAWQIVSGTPNTDGVAVRPQTRNGLAVRQIAIWANSSSGTIRAVKLELGDTQTLAHQENGVWVLNEIPNYGEQLVRCLTSRADSTDTYANRPFPSGMVKLWENSNSGTSFAAQTVSAALTGYSRVLINYKITAGDSGGVDFTFPIDSGSHSAWAITMPLSGNSAVGVIRGVSFSSAGVVFGDGLKKTLLSGNRETSNSNMVPNVIYGIP